MKNWVEGARAPFPEFVSDEDLQHNSGKAPPDLGPNAGEVCFSSAYQVQPGLAILGCGPTRSWTQLGNIKTVFSSTWGSYVSCWWLMVQTLKGKTQVGFSS